MLALARWVLLLAAVHTWSGPAIAAVIVAGIVVERLRRHYVPGAVI
jgi:hypothetical protein